MQNTSFTFDLEDHILNLKYGYHKRSVDDSYYSYEKYFNKIMEFLDNNSIKATFFIVGKILYEKPSIIKSIFNSGHEIALHSYDHTDHRKLYNKQKFLQTTYQVKSGIEDLISHRIFGYRAPSFTIDINNLWIIDILSELNFTYSSSLKGFKKPNENRFPNSPFIWPNTDLCEIPIFQSSLWNLVNFCFSGGIYFRYLPKSILNILFKKYDKKNNIFYCHSHDFDKSMIMYYNFFNKSVLRVIIQMFFRDKNFNKLNYFANYFSKKTIIDRINKKEILFGKLNEHI